MTVLTFVAEWSGEPAAGILSGYEEVTISFKHNQPLDEDTVEYWRTAVAEYYDHAKVRLESWSE